MIKRRLTFVLLLALLPFIGWAQQNYDGQHVSIKRTNGDSIQYDIAASVQFKPVIKEGKVVWSFLNWEEKENSPIHELELKEKFSIDNEGSGEQDAPPLEFELKEKFSIDNVEKFDFRSFEYDERESRKALIEFYQAMDGDNWERNDNWCSDKPIWEWYGVNGCLDSEGYKSPWVEELWFNCNSPVSGNLLESVSRMGPMIRFALPVSNLKCELPSFLSNIYSLNNCV